MPAGFGLSPQLGAVPRGSQPQQQPQQTLPSQQSQQQQQQPQGMLNWDQYNAWQRQLQQSYQQG
eukprot:3222576-Karenia_brevis.AAC.1